MYAANNAYANAGNTYKNNQVMAATQKKLIIMLYDGAIKNLKLSKMAMAEKNIEKANNTIIKAQNIILELMNTLNFEQGGEIAKNLHSLYQYMYEKTIAANIEKNPDHANEVIVFLEELKEVWEQI